MPVSIDGNAPPELTRLLTELVEEFDANAFAHATVAGDGSVTVETWMWNERFGERAEGASGAADAVARLRERLATTRDAGLLRSVLDVHEFMGRTQCLGPVGEALGEGRPSLRPSFALSRREALARWAARGEPCLFFFDLESGKNAALFVAGSAMGDGGAGADGGDGPVCLYLEDPAQFARFDAEEAFSFDCPILDDQGAVTGQRTFTLPVLGVLSSYEELTRRLDALDGPAALGRKPGSGTPFVVVESGGRVWMYDYVTSEPVELERIEGFAPAEVTGRHPARAWRDALQCPACRSALGPERGGRIECTGCHATFPVHDGVPHLIESDAQPAPLGEGEEWLMNPLPKVLPYLLRKYPNGLVLDCGSGNTPLVAPNLVNLEVFRFPNTTLVASGGRIPFRDNTFDAVLSAAVLEHVPDPFAYCREVFRVLKPGGEVRIDSAFLQPYHACPDHYFGTTASGLERAASDFEPVAIGVAESQSPFVALQTFLHAYGAAIPNEADRQRYRNTSVEQLLNLPPGPGPPFVRIPAARAAHLAAGVYLHGIKPKR